MRLLIAGLHLGGFTTPGIPHRLCASLALFFLAMYVLLYLLIGVIDFHAVKQVVLKNVCTENNQCVFCVFYLYFNGNISY